MPNSDLVAALDSGAVVVTPNNRLARAITGHYDHVQSAAGRTAWPSPRALPWNAWLATLWLDALAADAWPAPFALLDSAQSQHLWERAIEADGIALLDAGGAAERAADAWRTFHAHANPGESPSQFSGGGDDAAAFARWARRYARNVADLGCVDIAALADPLIAALRRVPFVEDRAIVLAGFVEFTPQQARFADALRTAGASVATQAMPSRSVARSRAQYRTATDELAAALQWARGVTLADPAARATIAVVDLSARLDLVVQLADEILRPNAVASAELGRPRPYNVSLAPPLSTHPLAVAALDLIELAHRGLPLARASALVRSPYLAGGVAAAGRRARLERGWREQNVTEVSLNALIHALAGDDPLRAGLMSMSQALRHATPRSPHAWADAVLDALDRCGWPGGDSQASALFQSHDALLRAIGAWRALSLVEPQMDLRAMLATLRAHCARTSFQPEGLPARIEILGVLEAAGLDFDGLWLAGMDADAWPPRVLPEAFLPVSWQRARGVVQASADHALERATRLTAQLAGSARTVIASHVMTTDHPPRSVSPLCDWPLETRAPQPTPTMLAIATAPALDRQVDATLPALPVGVGLKGGVKIVELQSDCPFRAAAALRLHAGGWPRPGIGLTALERGNLVHAAMASLWSSLGDQATLNSLDEATLQARIADAVAVARKAIADTRWRSMPPVIAGVETGRLARLMSTFLRDHEATRPPFRVIGSEVKVDLALGGLSLGLRIDRIDAVDAGIVVIDYKTGPLPSVRQWLLPRPVAPQTGLYALALKQRDPAQPVRAVALMSLRSGDSAVRGIADDTLQWEGLSTPAVASGDRLADFDALEQWWHARFGALAEAFRQGDAAVTPRDRPSPCAHCDFKPLCRIELHGIGDADDDAGEGEDGE